jgi:hypothetical protein
MSLKSSLATSPRPVDLNTDGCDFVASDPISDAIAGDPFVSRQDRNRIKPIDEILRNLSGYRIMDSPNPNSPGDLGRSIRSARASNQFEHLPQLPENSNAAIPVKSGLRLGFKPAPKRFSVTSLKQLKVKQTQSQFSTGLKLPAGEQTNESLSCIPYPALEVQEALRCRSNDQTADIPTQIDVRGFAPVETHYENSSSPEPEPIPGAYQYDPEFFEYHSIQRRLNQLDALDLELAHLVAAEPSIDVQSGIESSLQAFRESTQATKPFPEDFHAEEFGVVYAQNRQIIYVDGKDGFEFIDLSAFSLDQASFQANRIRIRTELQEFEVDYRNVSYALFANGQEVELAVDE